MYSEVLIFNASKLRLGCVAHRIGGPRIIPRLDTMQRILGDGVSLSDALPDKYLPTLCTKRHRACTFLANAFENLYVCPTLLPVQDSIKLGLFIISK